jgi:hypothetical protein
MTVTGRSERAEAIHPLHPCIHNIPLYPRFGLDPLALARGRFRDRRVFLACAPTPTRPAPVATVTLAFTLALAFPFFLRLRLTGAGVAVGSEAVEEAWDVAGRL